MGIRQAFIDYPDKIDDFHSTVTIFITIVSGSILIICALFGVISSINILLPLVCIIHGYSSSIIEDYSMYLMMQYRYKTRTFFMVMPNLVSVFISIWTIRYVINERLYLGRILPTAAITFLFGFFVLTVVFKKSFKFDISLLKYGLAISVPLIMHGAALSILAQSDRIMITALDGADKTGIYSVIYNFSMIATALSTALAGIWTPWFLNKLKSHSEEDLKRINKTIKLYVLFMTALMCGVILIAPEILKLLASECYWEGMNIIPPIVLANFVTFLYNFYVGVEHFHKKVVNIAVNTMLAAGSNVLLNLICIPLFGYEAAAYTTIISYVISFFLHYYVAIKLEYQMPRIKVYVSELFIIIAVGAIYYGFLDNWILRWGVALFVGAGIIFWMLLIYKKKEAQTNYNIAENG